MNTYTPVVRSDSERLQEAVDRLRRLETRFTKYLESQGFDTGTQRPRWRDGRIDVPSSSCSLLDCLSVVPPDWPVSDGIDIYVKERFLTGIYLEPPE